jgi:hypothetical protein
MTPCRGHLGHQTLDLRFTPAHLPMAAPHGLSVDARHTQALVALQADELSVDGISLTDGGGPGVGPTDRGSTPSLLSSAKSIEILRRQGTISQSLTPSSHTVPRM